MKDIQEDEVLFENTNEDPMIVATTSTTLSQATSHNATMLNEKLSQEESKNTKLKDEIISLKEEMNKRRKVECDMTRSNNIFWNNKSSSMMLKWNVSQQSRRWPTK